MQHPPFCPKTKERFAVNEARCVAWDDGISSWLESRYPEERRFIARYQAYAWHDRGDRWSRLWVRNARGPRADRFSLELRRCRESARAWRKWEREETK